MSTRIGRVQSIHRFPVKSMCGEDLEQCDVGLDGLRGDRAFALRDETAGEIRGAKRWPGLMMCSARYEEEPADTGVTHAAIALPDGRTTSTRDPAAPHLLSELIGCDVTLHPRRPASDTRHYRRVQPGAALAGQLAKLPFLRKSIARLATLGPGGRELRAEFGREPGEPMPDLSAFPELFEYVAPLGTYFDAYPIHVVTTATLAALRAKDPKSDWDARRFRANFVVETDETLRGLVEAAWAGRELRIGELRLQCTVATPRCSMIMQAQPALNKDPGVLRTVVREAEQCVGVYASVTQPGRIERGAVVELV
jgi:uncharacterized protein YcbX